MENMSRQIYTLFSTPQEDKSWYLIDFLAACFSSLLESIF